jgi:hypothetical protein
MWQVPAMVCNPVSGSASGGWELFSLKTGMEPRIAAGLMVY